MARLALPCHIAGSGDKWTPESEFHDLLRQPSTHEAEPLGTQLLP